MYGATIGKVGITDIEVCTNQACCVLDDSPFFDIRFIYYWFIGNRQHIISLSYGGGQPNISQELIRMLRIPTPPLEEQANILAFIDSKTTQLDTQIADTEQEIELLQEYRTALISEAVTGKIDVRQLEPHTAANPET
jgi:type I restriction enzyme S subunit